MVVILKVTVGYFKTVKYLKKINLEKQNHAELSLCGNSCKLRFAAYQAEYNKVFLTNPYEDGRASHLKNKMCWV